MNDVIILRPFEFDPKIFSVWRYYDTILVVMACVFAFITQVFHHAGTCSTTVALHHS